MLKDYDKKKGVVKEKPRSKIRNCPECEYKMILSEDKPDGLHFYCPKCKKDRKITWN